MNEATKEVKLLKSGPSNRTTFALGATGSGKTTLIANLILEKEERFVIFDAKNDYEPAFFGADCVVVSDVKQFAEALNERKPKQQKVIFRLHALDEESDATLDCALEFLCLFQRNNLHLGDFAVSIDELNRFAETSNWPPYLKEIIQRGRDYRIVKIFGAQWFNKIPPEMRDSFSDIYVFRHSEKVALQRLADYGFEPDDVKNLPAHTCLHAGKNGVVKLNLIPAASVTTTNQNAERELAQK